MAPRARSKTDLAAASHPTDRKEETLPWDDGSGVGSERPDAAPWFAMVEGKRIGPLVPEDLAQKLRAGDVTARTFLWRDGMANWKRAGELPEMAALLPQPASSPPIEPLSANPSSDRLAANLPWLGSQTDFFLEAENRPLEIASRPLSKLSLPGHPSTGRDAMPKKKAAPAKALDEAWFSSAPSAGEPDDATPGDATRFFIAEAGVHKRNPPWKIAAFAISLVAIPATALYLLSLLKVGPLVVTRLDAEGREVKESVFSTGGVSRLRDLLSGRSQISIPTPERSPARAVPAKPAAKVIESPPPSKGASSPDLKAFYADNSHRDFRPGARLTHSTSESAGGGLAQAEVAKVVARTQPAFRYCIERELKRNPAFKVGKIFIVATVGRSGTVKSAAIDRPEVDASSLGECLKSKARRMHFSAFAGDDAELQIPLILTAAL
jgi:hypothetical protein